MSGNAAFLEALKKTTITREKQTQSKIWGAIIIIGSAIATYFANDISTKAMILGAAIVAITMLYYTASNNTSSTTKNNGSFRPMVTSSVQVHTAPVGRTESSGVTPAAKPRNVILSPVKGGRDFGKHQDRQSSDWNENFDVQSPQRIAHAVLSEAQQQQNNAIAVGPTGTGLLPTSALYPNAHTNYGGKSNVANLGYQFAGNAASFGSPGGGAYGRTYQPEQGAPTWHAYHSSPTSEIITQRAASPVGAYSSDGRTVDDEEDDRLDDIVSRIRTGSDRPGSSNRMASPFSDRNLSVNVPIGGASNSGYSSIFTPSRGGTRSFATPKGARGRSNAGLTEDRLEHVLTKYLESQEQIVRELSQELLRLLAQRASSGAAAVPFLQSQDDLSKLRNLLELQADRQVMGNRTLLGLNELLRYCRSIGIGEDLLHRYEAAVAVLQSPNHTSYSNPSTPHAPAQGATHPSSGVGTHSSGTSNGNSSAYGSRLYNSIPEPVSSSGAFNSSRRTRY